MKLVNVDPATMRLFHIIPYIFLTSVYANAETVLTEIASKCPKTDLVKFTVPSTGIEFTYPKDLEALVMDGRTSEVVKYKEVLSLESKKDPKGCGKSFPLTISYMKGTFEKGANQFGFFYRVPDMGPENAPKV